MRISFRKKIARELRREKMCYRFKSSSKSVCLSPFFKMVARRENDKITSKRVARLLILYCFYDDFCLH